MSFKQLPMQTWTHARTPIQRQQQWEMRLQSALYVYAEPYIFNIIEAI